MSRRTSSGVAFGYMESFLTAEISAVRRVWKQECTLSGREIARTLGCSTSWTSVGLLSLVVGTSRVRSESVLDSTRTAPAAPVAARYAVRDARSWHIGQASSIPSKGKESTYSSHSEHHGVAESQSAYVIYPSNSSFAFPFLPCFLRCPPLRLIVCERNRLEGFPSFYANETNT